MSLETQVAGCTPLVIEPIGTSAFCETGPQAGEHLPADLAVQLAHAVDPLGQPHAHHGHVEHVRVAAGKRLGAERQHSLHIQLGDRQLRVGAVLAEVPLDEVAGETVDARRDRGVGGEHGAGPDRLQRLVEAQALVDVGADALQAEETGVALVGVEHLRLGVPGDGAEGPHRAHAADAEQQFLAEPVLGAAAVQPVGDLAQGRLVLLHVGVEQQQRDPAHPGQPDLRRQRLILGQGHGDPHRVPVGVAEQLQRQAVRVAGRVALALPAVGGQRLGEVAVPVQQADADQRHAQVAGRLEVVAGQDAEAAGVLRQHLGDAVLGREVRDRGRRRGHFAIRGSGGVPGPLEPARAGQVAIEVPGGGGQTVQETLVRRQRGQLFRAQGADHGDRVAAGGRPGRRVYRREQIHGLRVPGPAEIEHQLAQRRQRLRQHGTDGEPANGFHDE